MLELLCHVTRSTGASVGTATSLQALCHVTCKTGAPVDTATSLQAVFVSPLETRQVPDKRW